MFIAIAGPYTVFAPADAAFNNLPPKIQKIFDFGNWELMFDIVSYHITSDVYLIASMQNNGLYDTMLENSQLRFNKYPQVKVIYLMGSKFYSLYFFLLPSR